MNWVVGVGLITLALICWGVSYHIRSGIIIKNARKAVPGYVSLVLFFAGFLLCFFGNMTLLVPLLVKLKEIL